MMRAYEHAVRSRYRFYSYGDCMFVERMMNRPQLIRPRSRRPAPVE